MAMEQMAGARFIVNGDALPKANRDNIIVAPTSGQLNLPVYAEKREPRLA